MPLRGKGRGPGPRRRQRLGRREGRVGGDPRGGTAVKEEEWGRDTQGRDVLGPPPWLLMSPEGVQGRQGTDRGGAWWGSGGVGLRRRVPRRERASDTDALWSGAEGRTEG